MNGHHLPRAAVLVFALTASSTGQVATHLELHPLPDTVVSSQPFDVEVRIVDAEGPQVSNYYQFLELQMKGKGRLLGDNAKKARGPVVHFRRVAYRATADGESFEIVAVSRDDSQVHSDPDTLTAIVVATRLQVRLGGGFVQDGTLQGEVEVRAVDVDNRVDRDYVGSVRLSTAAFQGDLTGATSTAVDGIARFPDLAYAAADPTSEAPLVLSATAGDLATGSADVPAVASPPSTPLMRQPLSLTWTRLSDPEHGNASQPGLVVDGEGRVWASWQLTRGESGADVRLRVRDADVWGEAWSPMHASGPADKTDPLPDEYPYLSARLGVDADGRAWVAVASQRLDQRGWPDTTQVLLRRPGQAEPLHRHLTGGQFRADALTFDDGGEPVLVGALVGPEGASGPGFYAPVADSLWWPLGRRGSVVVSSYFGQAHVATVGGHVVLAACEGRDYQHSGGYGETVCDMLYPLPDGTWGSAALPGGTRNTNAGGYDIHSHAAVEALVAGDGDRAHVVYSRDADVRTLPLVTLRGDAYNRTLYKAQLRARVFAASGDSLGEWVFPYAPVLTQISDGFTVAGVGDRSRLFVAVARQSHLDLWVREREELRGPYGLADGVGAGMGIALASDGERLWIARDDGEAVYVTAADIAGLGDIVTAVGDDHAQDVGFAARAYPNPANASMHLVVDVPVESVVGLEVFDVLGQRVRGVEPKRLAPGPGQRLAIPAGGLASGVYFVRVEARTPERRWRTTVKTALTR